MRIAVMGSGGVDGFYGGRLAHAGYDVSFIARGAHLTAMQEHGLTIENEPQGNIHFPRVTVTGGYAFGRVAASYFANVTLPGALPIPGAAIVPVGAAIFASLMPAARASRVDVLQALRPE